MFTDQFVWASLIDSNMFLMSIIGIYRRARHHFLVILTIWHLFHLLASLFQISLLFNFVLVLMFLWPICGYPCIFYLFVISPHFDKFIICPLVNLCFVTLVCFVIWNHQLIVFDFATFATIIFLFSSSGSNLKLLVSMYSLYLVLFPNVISSCGCAHSNIFSNAVNLVSYYLCQLTIFLFHID